METTDDNLQNDGLNFQSEINEFIHQLNSLFEIYPLIMQLIAAKMMQESKQIDSFIENKKIKEEDINQDGKFKLLIPEEEFKEFIELATTLETSEVAFKYLPTNFVVAFVSQYDGYIGRLIKTMFLLKPELLNNSEKNILFSDLVQFQTIVSVRDFIIEKEIESVLRESHLKQFKWLETKLCCKLREDLPSFKYFIEITERRNLFVHCNGVVSRQYISTCKDLNIIGIEEVKVGDKLAVIPSYFTKCYAILFEIGVKLGQVMWRKLQPDKIKDADTHLNNVCYDLLIKGKFLLAQNLLTFATDTLKKHFDQEMICFFNINKALAFYLSGNKEESIKILKTYDWSATADHFKLAVSVLNEDYDTAINTMKRIGSSHELINKLAYKEWPLFKDFRRADIFKQTYKEIFKEEMVYIEPKPRKLEDILKEISNMDGDLKLEVTQELA